MRGFALYFNPGIKIPRRIAGRARRWPIDRSGELCMSDTVTHGLWWQMFFALGVATKMFFSLVSVHAPSQKTRLLGATRVAF
jgi:hypothetical protein